MGSGASKKSTGEVEGCNMNHMPFFSNRRAFYFKELFILFLMSFKLGYLTDVL